VGPRDNEILHHVTVPELMLDGVHVVWAGLLKESLNVVSRLQGLALAATCDSHDLSLPTGLGLKRPTPLIMQR
jgi:hypothetical protein